MLFELRLNSIALGPNFSLDLRCYFVSQFGGPSNDPKYADKTGNAIIDRGYEDLEYNMILPEPIDIQFFQ